MIVLQNPTNFVYTKTEAHLHTCSLCGVLHLTLYFNQRAERGQWRLTSDSEMALCQNSARPIFLKGPVPIR